MMTFNFDCESIFVNEQFEKSLNEKIKLETIRSISIYTFDKNIFNILKLSALIISITIVNDYEFSSETLSLHITINRIKNDFITLLIVLSTF